MTSVNCLFVVFWVLLGTGHGCDSDKEDKVLLGCYGTAPFCGGERSDCPDGTTETQMVDRCDSGTSCSTGQKIKCFKCESKCPLGQIEDYAPDEDFCKAKLVITSSMRPNHLGDNGDVRRGFQKECGPSFQKQFNKACCSPTTLKVLESGSILSKETVEIKTTLYFKYETTLGALEEAVVQAAMKQEIQTVINGEIGTLGRIFAGGVDKVDIHSFKCGPLEEINVAGRIRPVMTMLVFWAVLARCIIHPTASER